MKIIQPTRRDVLQLAGTAALAGVALPRVHAGGSETVQVALIGCGGRGTGAAEQAMQAQYGPTRLVAMADVFQGKLDSCFERLKKFEKTVDVPPDRKFIGFDGYQKAMDCLRPGDIAILTSPPAFRWVHFKRAIDKGLHVFMEKPVAVDAPTCKRMMELADEATKKNLKVGVGLMCRHCRSRMELFDRIKDGQIGQLTLLRCYRQHGPQAVCFSKPRPSGMSELMFQVQRFHSFLWASGGMYSDFYIHNIDECCWMKDAWPVEAKGNGGRHYRDGSIDQNFDVYSTEFTFADGAKMILEGRCISDCHQEFSSYAHGTKGSAVISRSGHAPSKARIFETQDMKATPTWRCPDHEPDPYQLEWDDLLEAIKKDKPYNEARRGAEASLVTAMGRMAAHTGQKITYDEMLKFDHEFAPDVDKLELNGEAPLKADENGKYPVPEPGKKKKKEY